MLKDSVIKTIIAQLADSLPQQFGSFRKDFEQQCQQILQKTLAKFDLVTREEFDVQTKVLAKSRDKLHELETQLAKLTSNDE